MKDRSEEVIANESTEEPDLDTADQVERELERELRYADEEMDRRGDR